MTDQENENRAGTENEETCTAQAGEAERCEAAQDEEIKKLTAELEKQADEIKKLKEEVARAPTTSTSERGWSATAKATLSSPPKRR